MSINIVNRYIILNEISSNEAMIIDSNNEANEYTNNTNDTINSKQ